MGLLEAEVHNSLRAFLRDQAQPLWDRHLTMARLVSRALRLQRPALIQTGSTVSQYAISYLMPALLSDRSVLLVAPPAVGQRLYQGEIPRLQAWLQTDKNIYFGECWPDKENFEGICLTSPSAWLSDRLCHLGHFPTDILTLIDCADELEDWTRHLLTVRVEFSDWQRLQQAYSCNFIQEIREQLRRSIFNHPQNPYECWLLDETERENLQRLGEILSDRSPLPLPFKAFWQEFQQSNQLLWASINRQKAEFTLQISPVEVASFLNPIWQTTPIVLIGGFLDADKAATTYRNTIGLKDELLCLKFAPNRQNESIQLYVPERLPMHNTPEFQGVLQEQVHCLVNLCQHQSFLVVIVDDVPLKAQIGSTLAAEFGSRIQVEKTLFVNGRILICGWDFWRDRQEDFPTPQLLIMATLPIPSLENPLVAGRVAYYKRLRRDWFRLYLLPTALKTIQRAVMPLRESQGVVALLDNRVNYRSYGNQILSALEPYAKINYIDVTWFG